MRISSQIQRLIATALVSLAAWSCNLETKNRSSATIATATSTATSPGSSGSLTSLAAFQSTVYPIVRARCVSCHIATIQPFFASDSASMAHDALISGGKVNLQDPAASRLVARLKVDLHNCWSDCNANATEMQAAIAKWSALIKPVNTSTSTGTSTDTSTSTSTATGTTPAARSNTISMPVPAILPLGGDAAANFVKITWPLDSAADTISPDITGATISFEIQKFDNFSYRVRNPKIISAGKPVYIFDLRLAVNGVIRANDATYTLLDQMVPISTTGTTLSSAPMVVLLDKGPGVDQLAVSFAKVQVSVPACKNLAGFTTMVKSVMTTSCTRCHGSGNVFDMTSGTDANICLRTLGRVDFNTPLNSSLIVKPFKGTNHDGGGNLINQTVVNNWVNWITSER